MEKESPVYFPAIQELEYPLLPSPQNNGNESYRGVLEVEHQCGVYAPSKGVAYIFKIIFLLGYYIYLEVSLLSSQTSVTLSLMINNKYKLR
jgi:hypothetical protein